MSRPSFRQQGSGLVRLAIPNKGRIAGPVNELIEKSGLHLVNGGERRLITRTRDPNVEILFAARSISRRRQRGRRPGITGRWVAERSAVEQVRPPDGSDARRRRAGGVGIDRRRPGRRKGGDRVPADHPFFGRGIGVTIVTVGGACEVTPHLGIADAIVDLSSSGTTLRTNHLRVIEEVLPSTTVLVANPAALKGKREKIDELTLALESVIRAKGQCYLMMNVHRNALADVREVLPGLSGPTVMDVASDENLVAVHAVVKEDRVYQ